MTWTKRFGTEQLKWLQDQGLAWPDKIRGDIYISPEELMRENLPQGEHGWTARPLYSPVYFYLSVSFPSGSRHEILGSGWPREDETELIPGGYDAVGNPRLDTLDDFRHFWNAADNVVAFILKDISENLYVVSNGEIKAALRLTSGPKTRQGTQLKLGRLNIGVIEGVDYCKNLEGLLASRWKARFNVLFCAQAPPAPNEQPTKMVVLPATYNNQPVPVNLQVWLAEHFKFSAVGKKFEETFPELYDYIKSNPRMGFDDVSRLLQSDLQRERSTEKIEFLGLKFPERDLATWGSLIIVIIQLYFWLHLRSLGSRLVTHDTCTKIAWIGLYPDIYARIVSFLTASMLPLAVMIYAILALGFSRFSLVPLIFGLLLAIWTSVLLHQIITKIASPISPKEHDDR